MSSLLTLENLQKSFRSHWTFRPIEAVKEVSLEVAEGESFGFLGHNGAGKTTTIKCIIGLIRASAGKIIFDGKELSPSDEREGIGYLPEQPYFYDHLSVFETLDFFATLYGISSRERSKKVRDTLEKVGLGGREKSSVRSLSKGLQQRLGFAQAIINEPKLLLLDEPFSGLDPIGRMEMRRLILEYWKKGTTILLSSHILSDVENICQRVSVMKGGELITVFSLSDSAELFGREYELCLEIESEENEIHRSLEEQARDTHVVQRTESVYATYEFDDYDSANKALGLAQTKGARVIRFEQCAPGLEEVYMEITNKGALS